MTRRPADAAAVRRLMGTVGSRSPVEAEVILTGGATAVLIGWRATTRDIDLVIEPPSSEAVLGPLVASLKEELELNIEFASPTQFIGELPGGRDRRVYIDTVGQVVFRHEDPYAQALSKVARDVDSDRLDVAAMVERGLVGPDEAWRLFRGIERTLYRYPVDPAAFRARMTERFGPPPGVGEPAA